jgi:hypothetical protein
MTLSDLIGAQMSKGLEWFKCYPSLFLKGTAKLNKDQFIYYTKIFMLCYDANGPIRENHQMIGNLCNSNARAAKRVIEELVQMDRLKRIEKDGNKFLIDERAEAVMAEFFGRFAARATDCGSAENIRENRYVSGNIPEKYNDYVGENDSTDFIEENRQVLSNIDFEVCPNSSQVSSNMEQVRPNISKFRQTCPENPSETTPILEEENRKRNARAGPRARAGGRARGLSKKDALAKLSALCASPREQQLFTYMVGCMVEYDQGMFVVPDFAKTNIQENIGKHMRALKLVVVDESYHETRSARASRESADGSGAEVSSAGAQEPQPQPTDANPDRG